MNLRSTFTPRPDTPPVSACNSLELAKYRLIFDQDIKKISLWPTPPPSYVDNDYSKAPYKQQLPEPDESPTLAYNQQRPMNHFSTTLDTFRNPQSPHGQVFMAEHIHMHHRQPQPLTGPPYPIGGPSDYLPHHGFPAMSQSLYSL